MVHHFRRQPKDRMEWLQWSVSLWWIFAKKSLYFNHGFNDRGPFARALLGRNPVAHGLQPKRAWFGECALLGRSPVAHGLRPKRAWFG